MLEQALESVVFLTTGPGICAGVLVDDAGTVATAYHCVSSGRRTAVRTRDGIEGVGRVIASDPRNDLALLHVPELEGRGYLSVRTGSAQVGEDVWAIGHPYATAEGRAYEGLLEWSVTRGIVSAAGPRLVQVDAALNPGNSGGPVVDAEGQVIGIASRKLRADNIAFVATGELLAELMEDPTRRPGGGSYALGLELHLPTTLATTSSIGVYGNIGLRDSLVASAGLDLPIGQRWQAVGRGESSYVLASAFLSGRARVGRGKWSTNLDLGPGVVATGRVTGDVDADAVRIVPGLPTALPAAQIRLELGGSALRWLVVYEGAGEIGVGMAVDLGWPGTIGAW